MPNIVLQQLWQNKKVIKKKRCRGINLVTLQEAAKPLKIWWCAQQPADIRQREGTGKQQKITKPQ